MGALDASGSCKLVQAVTLALKALTRPAGIAGPKGHINMRILHSPSTASDKEDSRTGARRINTPVFGKKPRELTSSWDSRRHLYGLKSGKALRGGRSGLPRLVAEPH